MSSVVSNHAPDRAPLARVVVLLTAAMQIITPLFPQLGFGQPIGEQSDSVRTLITPGGWAFSIWGPLYAGSIVFAVYQALPAQRGNGLIARLRWPAAGAFFGNALWAAYTQVAGLSALSALIIVWTLLCLLVAYRRLPLLQARLSGGERWMAAVPLSALAAWLTAATIVNIAAALRFHGVAADEAAPLVAALLVVVGGAIAGAALLRSGGNPVYALVFLWALAAIFAAGGQREPLVAAAAVAAAVAVIAGVVLGRRTAQSARLS